MEFVWQKDSKLWHFNLLFFLAYCTPESGYSLLHLNKLPPPYNLPLCSIRFVRLTPPVADRRDWRRVGFISCTLSPGILIIYSSFYIIQEFFFFYKIKNLYNTFFLNFYHTKTFPVVTWCPTKNLGPVTILSHIDKLKYMFP